MPTDQTPLERLADAVREFFDTDPSMPEGTFVTGWAVIVSTARIQSENPDALPMVDGARYALGPETSAVQAAGLAAFLNVVVERATWQMLAEQ